MPEASKSLRILLASPFGLGAPMYGSSENVLLSDRYDPRSLISFTFKLVPIYLLSGYFHFLSLLIRDAGYQTSPFGIYQSPWYRKWKIINWVLDIKVSSHKWYTLPLLTFHCPKRKKKNFKDSLIAFKIIHV